MELAGGAVGRAENMSMQPLRAVLIALGSLAVLAVGGCSGYNVELKGGVFDAMGISGKQAHAREPQVKSRQGLVVPPSTASLPPPGGAPQPSQVASVDGQNWPVDPEKQKSDKQAAIKAQHDAYCAKQREKLDAGLITTMEDGPLGSCRRSIVKSLTGKDPFWGAGSKPK